ELTPESWVVLELSSFQLIDLKHSPHISVCLMVVPEHLNWHADLQEYVHAKANLFEHQSPEDIAIYFADSENSEQIAASSYGRKIPYFDDPGAVEKDGVIQIDGHAICEIHELKLLGTHNWQNICAAVTAVWIAGAEMQNVEAIRSVLTTFTGLPHRLEMVRELDGVKYYDDSFGTSPETAMVAIEAFREPEILILGGRSKGIAFDELAAFIAMSENVKQVITIGETGPEIAALLRANGYQDVVEGGRNIDEIVKLAHDLARPGDIVLLSTACTSFDMFENYKQRGELFTAAVRELA
ncbi:MAG: UDP-N-acetylmuramoyl-L-alanine--D-glutamate ligase, partial [Candidatus Saccharimonadales bacterium]